jgi:hypothetical protein
VWTVGPRLFAADTALATLVSAALVAVLVGLVWHFGSRGRPLRFALGFATTAAILVSPLAWQFYLVLAILPAGLALGALSTRKDRRLAASLVALGLSPYVAVWLSVGLSALPVVPSAAMLGYVVGALPALCAVWLGLAENASMGVDS